MIYIIKNDILSVQVNSLGAELWGIRDLRDNADHLWYGDDKFWDRRASTMFPVAGNTKNNIITVNGVEYPMPMHGFFRDEETVVIEQTETMIRLRGTASEYTKTMFPFDFLFDSVFTVDGDTVHQKVEIVNNDNADMPFSVAFHPGFLCPFDAAHKNTEYKLRFEQKEDLINLWTPLQKRADLIKPDLFDTDTIEVGERFCVPIRYHKNIKSDWVQLEEIDSGRAVRMKISNFPTIVFWAVASADFPFVCFEPLEGEFDSVPYVEFKDRPGNLILKPNEKYENTLSISIIQPE